MSDAVVRHNMAAREGVARRGEAGLASVGGLVCPRRGGAIVVRSATRGGGLGEAISLFFRNYANFKGRSSRGAYWWWLLCGIVTRFGFLILERALFGADANDLGGVGPLTVLYLLATLAPELALGARRLHDSGRSGWWWLVAVVPILGVLLLLWLFAQPGARETNAFGPDVEAGRLVAAG